MNQAEILKKKVPNLNKARSPLKNVNSDMQYGLTHASVRNSKANCRKNVCTEIPSYSSHAPKLILEGVPAKVVDPLSRECCLKGYVFLLEPENKENAGDAVDIGGKNSI